MIVGYLAAFGGWKINMHVQGNQRGWSGARKLFSMKKN